MTPCFARHFLASLCGAVLLSACGGGGGDDTTVPPDARFDTGTALVQLLTASGSWAVTGRGSDGQTYSATLSVAPGARAAYPLSPFGTVGRTSVQRSTLTVPGVGPVASTSTVYIPDGAALPQGFAYDDGSCSTVEFGRTPPSSAALGSEDLLLSTLEFDGCTPATASFVGTTEVRWSVEAVSGVPYLCLTTTYYDEPGRVPDGSSDATCFEIDTAGRLGTRAIVRLRLPGFTLEMRG